MKPTKANMMRLAERLGVQIYFCPYSDNMTMTAPAGHHFALLGIHTSCIGNCGVTKAERYSDMIADLTDEYGRPIIERCTADTPCDDWGSEGEGDYCPIWGKEGVQA